MAFAYYCKSMRYFKFKKCCIKYIKLLNKLDKKVEKTKMQIISIDICYENKEYIWIQRKGLLNRDLEIIEKSLAIKIFEFIKCQGIVINDEEGMIYFDSN